MKNEHTQFNLGLLADPNVRVFVGFQRYRIIDGDTFEMLVDVGLHTFRQVTFRLLDVNAYETRGEHRALGKLATDAVHEVFGNISEEGQEAVKIVCIKTARGEKRGKYGRYLARVIYWDDGEFWGEGELKDLGQMLIDEKLAVPY